MTKYLQIASRISPKARGFWLREPSVKIHYEKRPPFFEREEDQITQNLHSFWKLIPFLCVFIVLFLLIPPPPHSKSDSHPCIRLYDVPAILLCGISCPQNDASRPTLSPNTNLATNKNIATLDTTQNLKASKSAKVHTNIFSILVWLISLERQMADHVVTKRRPPR